MDGKDKCKGMTAKERKVIEPIIESTRWKLKEAGYLGALVVGKDAAELRECIKNTFIGLLADADIEEVKKTVEMIDYLQFTREKNKPKPEPVQLYLFK